MQDDTSKQYCVVDHTAKANDRHRMNPNRLAKEREAERWLAALQELLADDDVLPPTADPAARPRR